MGTNRLRLERPRAIGQGRGERRAAAGTGEEASNKTTTSLFTGKGVSSIITRLMFIDLYNNDLGIFEGNL